MAIADITIDDFLRSSPVPADLETVRDQVTVFIREHQTTRRRIVLVTSGGTTVPLEKQTVRYLDNFSTGTRGSLSAEQFLSQGYAVIFLYRQSSFRPFHCPFTVSSLLDLMDISSTGDIIVCDKIKHILEKYKEIKSTNLLYCVPFTTIFDYVHYLNVISPLMNTSQHMIYLAAAVSDFFIHPDDMVEHKISSSTSLSLHLQQVPKLIAVLTQHWSPNAFIVSFKLETDESILVSRARKALTKYGHQVVVANTLVQRKEKVTVVERDKLNEEVFCLSVEEKEKGVFIEEKLISYLCHVHKQH